MRIETSVIFTSVRIPQELIKYRMVETEKGRKGEKEGQRKGGRETRYGSQR